MRSQKMLHNSILFHKNTFEPGGVKIEGRGKRIKRHVSPICIHLCEGTRSRRKRAWRCRQHNAEGSMENNSAEKSQEKDKHVHLAFVFSACSSAHEAPFSLPTCQVNPSLERWILGVESRDKSTPRWLLLCLSLTTAFKLMIERRI